MGKVEIGIYFCVTADDKIFTEMFLYQPYEFVQVADFNWWPAAIKKLNFQNKYSKSSQKP